MTQDAKHAPGPWKLEIEHALNNTRFRIHNGKQGVCAGSYPTGEARHEADCRLMTAAPRLLAALRNLTATARTFRNVPAEEQAWTSIDDDALEEAFAAIAEAEGLAV